MGASKKKRGKKTGKEWAKAHCSQGMQAADGTAPGRSEQERWCVEGGGGECAWEEGGGEGGGGGTAAATAAPGAGYLRGRRSSSSCARSASSPRRAMIPTTTSIGSPATRRRCARWRRNAPSSRGARRPRLAAQLHERAGRVDAAARAAAVAIDAAASNPVVRGVARLVRGRCLHALGQNSDCFALLLTIEEEEGKALPFLAGCASREAARLAPNELVGQARERFTALVNGCPPPIRRSSSPSSAPTSPRRRTTSSSRTCWRRRRARRSRGRRAARRGRRRGGGREIRF